MKKRRLFESSVTTALWIVSLAVTCICALPLANPSPIERNFGKGQQEFLAALAAADAAQLELQNGKAAAYKALWSHSDEVTLIGGFGGSIETGWAKVEIRLDWAAAQFSNGSNTIERLITHSNDTIGYVIQIEHIRFQVPGQSKETTRDYRVTMVFMREPEGWKIVHRHADSQMMKQAPQ